MNILLLANHFNTGGISTYLMTLAGGYVHRGHKVWIATAGGDLVAAAEALDVRHITIPALHVKCEFHPGLLLAAGKVSRLVKENGINIIHAQTRVTQSVAALAGLWSGREYVSTCHGFFKPRLSRRVFPLWGRGVVAISRPVVDHLVKDLKVQPELISLVPNGIDTDKFHPVPPEIKYAVRQRFDVGNEPLVGIIARLSDVKGHCHLINAMNELVHKRPDIKCLIFGEGPLEATLKDQVEKMKLSATVKFFCVNGQTADLLPMFDVFAMPSIQEGLGLSVMEAQSCGVPVVASRVGGLVEAVIDGETGILVPPQEHLPLADALAKVLFNKELAQRFANNGRRRMITHFTVDAMVEGTLEVYRKALDHA